jgi:hypothetical protein
LPSILAEADTAFVDEAAHRLQLGEEKYGPFKFLGADTLQEAMEEVLDLGNYARMTYIKLYILQKQLNQFYASRPEVKEGFISAKEMFQGGN